MKHYRKTNFRLYIQLFFISLALGAVLLPPFFGQLAYADYFYGNDLIKLMDSREIEAVSVYRGYVAGVQDSFNGVYFCMPPNVRLSQACEIVTQYVKMYPTKWHETAKNLIIEALKNAFPCKK